LLLNKIQKLTDFSILARPSIEMHLQKYADENMKISFVKLIHTER